MRMSDAPPSGTAKGFIRLQKVQGATYVQIVDLTRYELTNQCIRFREENWISTKGSLFPSSMGRNTDDFNTMSTADEYFAWWLKSKVDDRYTILHVGGAPGPLPVNMSTK